MSVDKQALTILANNFIPPYFTQFILFWLRTVKTVSNFHQKRWKSFEKSGGFMQIVSFTFLTQREGFVLFRASAAHMAQNFSEDNINFFVPVV